MIAAQQSGLVPWVVLFLYLASATSSAVGQQPAPRDSTSPCGDIDAVLVVEGLWNYASAGELLSAEGWTHAMSQFFTGPSDFPQDFTVVGNHYGVSHASRKGERIEITVQSAELGRIDSQLRFTTNPSPTGNPDFYISRLVFGPTPSRWRIEGPLGYRWTTVNTAIRYVSEVHDNSKDPVVKKNAEKTLDVLRKYK